MGLARWALVLCACGRVGFDARDDGGGSTGDATDANCVADITSGLIAWWKLDDGFGTNAHEMITGNDGTLTGGATWAAGHHNGAVAFNGIDGSVEIGTSIAYARQVAPFTFSAWVQLANYSTMDPVIMQIVTDTTSPWNVLLSSDAGYLGISVGAGDTAWVPLDTMMMPTTNMWHHVAVSFAGTNAMSATDFAIWLDGALMPLSFAAGYGSIAQSSRIGAGRDALNRWPGMIEDVRIYGRALSPAEIMQVFAACH